MASKHSVPDMGNGDRSREEDAKGLDGFLTNPSLGILADRVATVTMPIVGRRPAPEEQDLFALMS